MIPTILRAELEAKIESAVKRQLLTRGEADRLIEFLRQLSPEADAAQALVAHGLVDPEDLDLIMRCEISPEPASETLLGAAAEESVSPRKFGRYLLMREIGRGGMGRVFLARDTTLDRVVALKVLSATMGLHSDIRERFFREARALARLNHPNVVRLLDFGTEEGDPYFTMEFVDGLSLAQALEGKQLKREEVVCHIATIARAVDAMHQHGFIHRDIKPANVILASPLKTESGLVKAVLVDLGLALELEGGTRLTVSGGFVGTPAYMAPEQIGGKEGPQSPATDVWGLGATLYEAVVGRPPFDASSAGEILARIESGDLPSPRKLNPTIPRDLETVILKALNREPDRRYRSARGMAEDLERFLSGEPILARPTNRLWRAWRRIRRRRTVWVGIAIAAVGLVLGTLAAVQAYRKGRSSQAEVQKMLDEARTYLDEAFRMKVNKDTQVLAGIRTNLDRASDCLKRALTLVPDLAAAHVDMARIAWEKEELDAANLHLDRAVQIDPEFFPARFERARLSTWQYLFRRLRSFCAILPLDMYAWFPPEDDVAAAWRQRALKDWEWIRQRGGEEEKLARALQAFLGEDFATAADAFEEYLKVRATDPSGHIFYGLLQVRSGGKGVIKAFETALQYDAHMYEGLSMLANAYILVGRSQDALALCERASAQTLGEDVLFTRAVAKAQQAMAQRRPEDRALFHEAIDDMEKAIQMNPEYSVLDHQQCALFNVWAAEIWKKQESQGELEEHRKAARLHVEACLRLSPEHPHGAYAAAVLAKFEGKLEEAEEWATKSLQFSSKSMTLEYWEARIIRGEARARLGNYRGALEDIEALLANPAAARYRESLQKNYEEAKRRLQTEEPRRDEF